MSTTLNQPSTISTSVFNHFLVSAFLLVTIIILYICLSPNLCKSVSNFPKYIALKLSGTSTFSTLSMPFLTSRQYLLMEGQLQNTWKWSALSAPYNCQNFVSRYATCAGILKNLITFFHPCSLQDREQVDRHCCPIISSWSSTDIIIFASLSHFSKSLC